MAQKGNTTELSINCIKRLNLPMNSIFREIRLSIRTVMLSLGIKYSVRNLIV